MKSTNDADNSLPDRRRRGLGGHFLRIFAPLFVLLSGVIVFVYLSDVRSQRTVLESGERQLVRLLEESITDDFRVVSSDLLYLARLPELITYLDHGGAPQVNLVATLLLFAEQRGMYDQVRYLDESGMEIVRINANGGKPKVVPQEQLQSKSRRYYFEDTVRLDRDQVYVSPFDLNIEHDQIEQPLKPMIRFGTPVYDSAGRKRGVVLLNYLGKELLDHLQKLGFDEAGTVMLLNAQGYWLKGARPEDEWGFMYKDRRERTFGQRFPEEWRIVNRMQRGQTMTHTGLFTFATLYPLHQGQLSSSGSPQPAGSSAREISAASYNWKLISHVPLQTVKELLHKSLPLLLGAYLVLLGLLLALSLALARSFLRRDEAEATIRSMAFHDNLTGLPNRLLFMDRFGQARAKAERNGGKVALMFLDLDNFKEINDSYGHDRGDLLLRHFAERLLAQLRRSDTLARLGGDEFVIFLPEVKGRKDATTVARKLIGCLSEPFPVNGKSVMITASIGVALYPDDAVEEELLLQYADAAMYRAKRDGRNRFSEWVMLKQV